MPEITYHWAHLNDLPALEEVGDTLFDYPIKPGRTREFLNDPRHHLLLAREGNAIVGMASAFHYVHPDKDPTLFVNEVSVLESHWNQGIGRTLVKKLVDYGKAELDCHEAWVATEVSNKAAQKAYLAAGGKEDDELAVVFEF